jgi:hypothetical protein
MTYETNPVRWTAQPESAPECLREPLEAGGREGPSKAQMHALSLKLAALAAGGAAAGGAAAAGTAHASAQGAGALTVVPAVSGTKLLLAVSLGAVALGGGAWWMTRPSNSELAQQVAPRAGAVTAPITSSATDSASRTPKNEVGRDVPRAATLHELPSKIPSNVVAGEEGRDASPSAVVLSPLRGSGPESTPARDVRPSGSAPNESAGRVSERNRRAKRGSTKVVAGRGSPDAQRLADDDQTDSPEVVGKTVPPSEVELLRRARAALAASPRDAFTLTEAHREYYPRGTFAQERDALGIEALMRSGDMARARILAEEFVSKHPNSPHAHRFREAMGLR